MDAVFLAGLHALAASTADALEGRASLARDANNYQAAEVADLAANGFRALAELVATHLGAERARLAAAVRDAETAASAADADFGTWDHAAMRAADRLFLTPDDRARIVRRLQAAETAAEEAHRAVEAARAALEDFDAGRGRGMSDHCADCGRELGLSGGRVDGKRICLDCCAVRARAKATPLDTGETLIVVTRSAYDLATLDTAYDLLRALVNEHRAARIAVLVRVGSRAVFDGVMLSTARETPNYGGKVRELASGYSARTAITLEVRLR